LTALSVDVLAESTWAGSHRVSEKGEIKRMGGRPQKNSGRGKIQKGDATLGPFIVDVKEYKKSFGISEDMWAKISTDAFKGDKEPALALVMGDRPTRLWVIGDQMFHQMLKCWEETYGE
jgi:hypothetical protein